MVDRCRIPSLLVLRPRCDADWLPLADVGVRRDNAGLYVQSAIDVLDQPFSFNCVGLDVSSSHTVFTHFRIRLGRACGRPLVEPQHFPLASFPKGAGIRSIRQFTYTGNYRKASGNTRVALALRASARDC